MYSAGSFASLSAGNSTKAGRPASDSLTLRMSDGDTDPNSKNLPFEPRRPSIAPRSLGKISGHA